MEQMESGWDPGVKKFFVKILNSIALGSLWIIAMVMAGIYYKLGFIDRDFSWPNIVFYLFAVISLFFLLRYLYKQWK